MCSHGAVVVSGSLSKPLDHSSDIGGHTLSQVFGLEHICAWTETQDDETGEATTRYMRLGASVEEVRKRLVPGLHWYLMVFGAEASYPEKSISETLIEPVLSRADSTGMPCYLETFSEKRLAFYKDFSFRITGAGRIPDGGPNFWAMTRAAMHTAL